MKAPDEMEFAKKENAWIFSNDIVVYTRGLMGILKISSSKEKKEILKKLKKINDEMKSC